MIHKGGEFQDGHIKNWFPRFDYARREGWLNRSIACLGMLFGEARSLGDFSLDHVAHTFMALFPGKSELNPTGWSQAELRATVQEIKDRYPEMP